MIGAVWIPAFAGMTVLKPWDAGRSGTQGARRTKRGGERIAAYLRYMGTLCQKGAKTTPEHNITRLVRTNVNQ